MCYTQSGITDQFPPGRCIGTASFGLGAYDLSRLDSIGRLVPDCPGWMGERTAQLGNPAGVQAHPGAHASATHRTESA